jgi:hypothetical protein
VEHLGGARDLPGPRATLFFAPAQAKKRQADWGGQELGRRIVTDWHAFREHADRPDTPWLRVERHRGAQAVQQAYVAMLAGRANPATGHVLSFA